MGGRRQEVRREGRLKLTAPAAALLAGLLLAAPSWAELAGRVVAVHDGDTITVLVAGRGVRVRLAGIDAPERGQAFSNASRHALEAQVAGREVRVFERGRDGYGRILGRVYAGSVDVNAEQVRAGFAWVFRRYEQNSMLLALEAEAKAAQRGLWQEVKPVPPWVWRERQALHQVSFPRRRAPVSLLNRRLSSSPRRRGPSVVAVLKLSPWYDIQGYRVHP